MMPRAVREFRIGPVPGFHLNMANARRPDAHRMAASKRIELHCLSIYSGDGFEDKGTRYDIS